MPTIVVIEDNDADVLLLEHVLGQSGTEWEIRTFADGVEGREYVAAVEAGEPPPDLVLLDLNVPREDGLTLLARLRRSASFAGVPVVVWSSTRSERDHRAAASLGIADFLVKPARLEGWEDLVPKLRRVLRPEPHVVE